MNPNTVPNGPAAGRKDVPGMTKEPHPMQTPNDKAKAPIGVRYLASPELLLFSTVSFSTDNITNRIVTPQVMEPLIFDPPQIKDWGRCHVVTEGAAKQSFAVTWLSILYLY